ncbi:hypothetical protein DFH09DRAFT_1074575 [Mycena vulgaris]|nr:hypothetical protein DFH09DRAFT_1074575 [Mycena vulgaris]
MAPLLPQLVTLSIVAAASSSYITGRHFTAIQIDGNNAPWGVSLQLKEAHVDAVAEYKEDFNKNPDDPNAPDFIAWAYTHVLPYQSAYQLCEDNESTYKDLLATFIPETVSATSSTKSPSATRTTSSSATTVTSQEGNSNDGIGSNTGGSSRAPSHTVLALAVVAGEKLLLG